MQHVLDLPVIRPRRTARCELDVCNGFRQDQLRADRAGVCVRGASVANFAGRAIADVIPHPARIRHGESNAGMARLRAEIVIRALHQRSQIPRLIIQNRVEIRSAVDQGQVLRGFQIDKLVEALLRNLNLPDAARGLVSVFLIRVTRGADHVSHRLRQVGLAVFGAVVDALIHQHDLPLLVDDDVIRLRIGETVFEQLFCLDVHVVSASDQLFIRHVDRGSIIGKRDGCRCGLGRRGRRGHIAKVLVVEIQNLHADDHRLGRWRRLRRSGGFCAAKSKKSGNHKTRQRQRLGEMSS